MKYYILCENYDGHNIELDTCNSVEVIPEAVGQSIELKDKNGIEMFEGDICYENYYKQNMVIEYSETEFIFVRGYKSFCIDNVNFVEVIGNIHDNPELLE